MNQNIAIFASGAGSNTLNIIQKFENSDIIVKLIVTNNSKAGVIDIAKEHEIPYLIISKNDIINPDKLIEEFLSLDLKLIVLAGFLWLIPIKLLDVFKNKIINIHPALLPLYGGKGMYGMKVHKAVKEAGDKLSGITIHYVNENYDEGDIIFQQEVNVDEDDSPDTIAYKIHKLEYKYFPEVIKSLLM